jgi:glycosyltransferase involved in cell wall biosynthesis
MPKIYENNVVYVVSYSKSSINARVKGILSLRNLFGKLVHVTCNGKNEFSYDITTGAYPNPLGLLNLIGLRKTKLFLERYIYFPSTNILYAWKAIKLLKYKIAQDINENKRVYLITCVPPHDIAYIGLPIKKMFPKIFWIVDWQDLWSYDEYYNNKIPRINKKRLNNLEKKIFLNCDINVTTNKKAKNILEDYYNIPSQRILSINHHFNLTDISGQISTSKKNMHKNKKLNIDVGFLGNLFKPPKVPGMDISETFNKLFKSGLNVKLHIFGDKSKDAKKAASRYKNSIILHPRVNHKESLKNISRCDFFLLALSNLQNCQIIMHSKLPHYLMLGKPIIAIVPENSAVADIIHETKSGYVIPSSSCWTLELTKILKGYLNGTNIHTRNEDAISKFSWDHISAEWIKVLTTN